MAAWCLAHPFLTFILAIVVMVVGALALENLLGNIWIIIRGYPHDEKE